MDPDIYGLSSLREPHAPEESLAEPNCPPTSNRPATEPLTLDQLYRNAHPQLFLRLRQHGYSPHDAEDLVQEAFMLALTELTDLSREAGAFSWLREVAYFKGKNLKKKEMRREQLLRLHSQRPITAKVPDDPQTLCRTRELRKAIDACPQGDYFFLAKVLGLKSREIAALLDIPRGTAATRISRGGRQLADYATEHGIDLPELLRDHQDPRKPVRRHHGNVIPLFPLAAAGTQATPTPQPVPGGLSQLKWLWASGLAAMGVVTGALSMQSPTPMATVAAPMIEHAESSDVERVVPKEASKMLDLSNFPIPERPDVDERTKKPEPPEPPADPRNRPVDENRSLKRLRRLIQVDRQLSEARLHLTMHNRQFPRQQMASTRMLLSLELDCRLGARVRARSRAREIVRRWPSEQSYTNRIFRQYCKA